MQTSNEIVIKAPYERIFTLGAETERWPERLPHYRYVRVLHRDGNRKRVKMSAWRSFIPVTWTAEQTVEQGKEEAPGRILFHHVKGLVRGMDVVWSFEALEGGGWRVRIEHDLKDPPMPTRLLGRALIERVVGRGFIGHIAGRTLARIKWLAERDAR